MNLLKKPLTALCAVAVVITLLLTVVANVVFGDINYYQREFEKYNVTENIDMSMEDIMSVMKELMDYLHDDRENLEGIETTVNGKHVMFFTDREKTHMADCKVLFDGGFAIRNVSFGIFAVLLVILIITKSFDYRFFLKSCGVFSVCILALCVFIAIAASINFDACFEIFHKIFFNNDLWIFDPSEDLIINVLVEELFMDIALKIGIWCMAILAAFTACGAYLFIKDKKRVA